MKLYYKPGACSMAAHIILNEVSAPHSLEKVDTGAGITDAGQAYSDINPRGYVPALRLEDGDVITENSAVLQFLGDHFADHALIPKAGTKERLRLQEVLSFLSSELHVAFSPFFTKPEMNEERKQSATQKLTRKIGEFDALLPDAAPFILGDGFSVADAYAFVILNWTNFIGVSLDPWPKLVEFQARIGKRPAVMQTLQEEGLAA